MIQQTLTTSEMDERGRDEFTKLAQIVRALPSRTVKFDPNLCMYGWELKVTGTADGMVTLSLVEPMNGKDCLHEENAHADNGV